MIELYEELGAAFIDRKELIGVGVTKTFDNYIDMKHAGHALYYHAENDTLKTRKMNELHFYNYLKNQLFSRLQEIKYYSDVNIFDTRRMVAVSTDCISYIQILVRDKIHVNVYFRSSDYDGALPCDLEFINTLPLEFFRHLSFFKGKPGYNEINSESLDDLRNKKIVLNVTFGSLHRTV